MDLESIHASAYLYAYVNSNGYLDQDADIHGDPNAVAYRYPDSHPSTARDS